MPEGVIPTLEERFHFGREVGTLLISLFVGGYCVGPLFWGPLSETVSCMVLRLNTDRHGVLTNAWRYRLVDVRSSYFPSFAIHVSKLDVRFHRIQRRFSFSGSWVEHSLLPH